MVAEIFFIKDERKIWQQTEFATENWSMYKLPKNLKSSNLGIYRYLDFKVTQV